MHVSPVQRLVQLLQNALQKAALALAAQGDAFAIAGTAQVLPQGLCSPLSADCQASILFPGSQFAWLLMTDLH